MEWGFGQQAGPFRTWDLLGVKETVEQMERLGLVLPSWGRAMLEQGNSSFYKREDGRELVYNPTSGSYEPVRTDPGSIALNALHEAGQEVASNEAASLLDLGDAVLCFEIHSQASGIGAGVLGMASQGLQTLE